MNIYINKSGKSGVVSYDFSEDHMDILFSGNSQIYRYKIAEIGSHHLLKMIRFALEGAGLATYISQHPEIKNNYDLI